MRSHKYETLRVIIKGKLSRKGIKGSPHNSWTKDFHLDGSTPIEMFRSVMSWKDMSRLIVNFRVGNGG